MAAVKDIYGNEWSVNITTSSVLRIREHANIDLLKILEDKSVLGQLFGDMVAQTDVLYWACHLQTQQKLEKPLQLEQWRDMWDGTTLEAAMAALLESLASFFPKQKGQALREGVKATQNFVDRIYQKAQTLAQGMQGEAAQALIDRVEQNLQIPETVSQPTAGGESSGAVPESSESIPDHSPPPNSSA